MPYGEGLFHVEKGQACSLPNTSCFFVLTIGSAVPILFLLGSVMVEQVKSVDYISRKVKFIEKASDTLLSEALGILDACIY